jgi:hypothetical protein
LNPELTINPKNGAIHIAQNGCCLVIDSNLTSDTASIALAPFYRSELDHQNGYVWRSYHGISIGGIPGAIALCFHAGRLIEAHIGLSIPNAGTENAWPSKELIEWEVQSLRSSLMQQLSRPFQTDVETFSWGSAWANFDAKAFSASAGVKYMQNPITPLT